MKIEMKRLAAAGAIAAAGVVLMLLLRQPGGMEREPQEDANEHLSVEDNGVKPVIIAATRNEDAVGLYEKLELTIELEARYDSPYDPDQVDVHAMITSPGGRDWRINGFFDGSAWKLRFAPDEEGGWTYRVFVRDEGGTSAPMEGAFQAVASQHKGWIQLSAENSRFLRHRSGESFFGVSLAYPWNVTAFGLDRLAGSGANLLTYWNGNYDNAGNGGGSNQLESKASGIGVYDPMKAMRIDELLESFERRDLYMNLAIWPHDSLTDKLPGWPAAWQRSAYASLGAAVDFYADEEMWRYQEKLYRYIIARWGYSRALGIWDIIVEINGTDGWALGNPAKANEWATKVNDYFKQNDPYGHPTTGSMAGGANDYWDHGYRTFDLSNRENYYDLGIQAYVEDIRQRWDSYEKPLIIGETGNVADPALYHNAIWASLAAGIASSPAWWEYSLVNDAMLERMKHFSDFVADIDFNEARMPVTAVTRTFELELSPMRPLMEDAASASWLAPDWADANKDGNGVLTTATVEETASAAGEAAAADTSGAGAGAPYVVSASFNFATGGFSQGALQHQTNVNNWSGYASLQLDVYLEPGGVEDIRAVPVLFPAGEWTEAADSGSALLRAGEWITIDVPLLNPPAGYWRERVIDASGLANIAQWGLKVYSSSTPSEPSSTIVKIREARLVSESAPVVTLMEAEAWAMHGKLSSYGWVVSQHGAVGGKPAELPGWSPGLYMIKWYDPWSGTLAAEAEAVSDDGVLSLLTPPTDRGDLAFYIEAR